MVLIAGIALYFGLNDKDSLTRLNLVNVMPSVTPAEGQEAVIESDPVFAQPLIYGQLKQLYSGQNYSFKYPDGFKVSPSPVGDLEEIVTIENSKGSGFQIFILAFDESGPITPERIQQDLPDAEINDPKNADLDGAKTLVFNGYDEDMGETFESWTVHKGKLYQISGPKTAERLVIETLETWEWK